MASSMTAAEFALTCLIQSTVLLVLGLIVGRLVRRSGPAVQSALYRTTLGAVLLCPCVSMLLTAVGFNGLMIRLPSLTTTAAAESPARIQQDRWLDERAEILEAATSSPAAIVPQDARVGEPRSPAGSPRTSRLATVPSPSAWSRALTSLLAWGVLLGLASWLLGSAALGARLLVSHWYMVRLRSAAVQADPAAQALCREIALRMRVSPPAVLRTPLLSSPCLDGLRRPAILLPEDAEENLRETFVHELAHLARRDGLWNLLRKVSTAALWVQPLLWLLSRRLEVTAEEVCDDYVVQFGADRSRYAGHLLDLAERTLLPLAPAGVGMISLRSLLARRVTRMLDTSRTLSTRAGARAIAVTLLAGLAGTLLAGLIGVEVGNRPVLGDEPKVEKPAATLKPSPEATQPKNDVPITGRIVDLEGRPVAGATVRIMSYATPRTGDLTPWLDAIRSDQPAVIARRQHLDFLEVPAEAPRKATTDPQGRFRFESFGAERIAHVLLEGPTIATAFFTVVTRPIESFRARGDLRGPETIYGADFTYSAAPGRPVEGIVRDAKTKRPLAGVIVQSRGRLTTNVAAIPYLETATDDQGRFRLVGLSKERISVTRANVGYPLTFLPSDDQPYFVRNISVPDPPGIEPVAVEVELYRGIWITGKVTDKRTGQPITGVRLHYFPFLENKFAQATPEFGPNRSVLDRDRYQTKSDGTYRLVGLPGRAIIGVVPSDRVPYRFGYGSESIKGMDERGQFATYWNPGPAGKTWLLAMKEINPVEGTEAVHLDLELDPGATVRVRVVDREGKPVHGSSVIQRTSTGARATMPQADFDVVALGPGDERIMLVRHVGRKLGKAVRIHPGDDKAGPVMVTLEPLATIVGRVADADGNPVSGATIRSHLLPLGSHNATLPEVATGKDGRFQVPDVPTGADYALMISSRGNRVGNRTVRSEAKVRPGETTDVGEVRFKGD